MILVLNPPGVHNSRVPHARDVRSSGGAVRGAMRQWTAGARGRHLRAPVRASRPAQRALRRPARAQAKACPRRASLAAGAALYQSVSIAVFLINLFREGIKKLWNRLWYEYIHNKNGKNRQKLSPYISAHL